MKQQFFSMMFVSLTFSAFSQNANYIKEQATGYRGSMIKNLKAVKGLSFCVIGDWGRYGDYYQKAVADN